MLNRPTLVLNKTWTPINVTTVRRAIVLAFVDLARIVDVTSYELFSFENWVRRGPTNGQVLRGVNTVFDVPEVVVVKHYDKVPSGGVVFSRRNLYRRDRFTCQYCGARPGSEELTIDHVVPKCKGGRTTWENCVLACLNCNTRKGGKSLQDVGLTLRSMPKKPTWSPIYAFARRSKRPKSWDAFISEAYWNTELED
jgi:5-methylcytosine-specific restriction endonuclease McrA